MRRTFLVLVVLGLGLCFGGCFTHVYDSGDPTASTEPNYEKWHHHFVFGLLSVSGDIQFAKVCPSGVARIEDYHSFLNTFLGGLTMTLWHPTTVKVWCKGATGAVTIPIEMTDELVQRILSDFPDAPQRAQQILDSQAVPAT
jgi:hypothetical protein